METRHAARANYAQAARNTGGPAAPLPPALAPAPPAPAPALAPGRPNLQLPTYWSHNPVGWFAFIETRFRLHNVMDENARYEYASAHLTEEAVDLVIDLLQTPPVGRPYGVLRQRLLREHQLTPLQKAERLSNHPEMGDRTPSQLLTAMLKVCPEGEQETYVVKWAFISRLPEPLKLLLGNNVQEPIRDLAQRADGHWATQSARRPVSGINAVDEAAAQEDLIEAVNAVRFQGKGKSKGKGPFRGRNDKSGKGSAKAHDGGNRTGGMQTAPPESGLCSYHWSFGKGARSCESPCSWTGN